MAPVRVARAFRLPIIAIVTTLALSGCMRATTSVAEAQPSSELDAMAYGQSGARRDRVTPTHTDASAAARIVVPLGAALGPGDTVLVGDRWF
jgi:hypothetical protein